MEEKPAATGGIKTGSQKRQVFRWLVFLELLALFAFAYLNLASHLLPHTGRKDADIRDGDQLRCMRLATETRGDLQPGFKGSFMKPLLDMYPHRTDGVINPLWPWVAAWFTEPDHRISDEEMTGGEVSAQSRELFIRGRWFHVFMTLVFLVMLGIAACRIFTLPAAVNLVLLGGLGALLPRSAFFQPEPLYYVLFFLTWVACILALKHNTLWIYGCIGVLGGAAWLANASASLLILLFVGVSSLRCLWEMLSARRRGFALSHASLWHWRNHLVGLVVLGSAFLMTTGPRLKEARERFGEAFFSYPAVWMWLDSREEAREWMQKHGDKETLSEILPVERPSLSRYLRTHSRDEIIARVWNGTLGAKGRVHEFFWPAQTHAYGEAGKWTGWRGILEWRGVYLAWLALVMVALLGLLSLTPRAQHAGHIVFRHGTIVIVLFVAGTFAVYSLASGFYAPVAQCSGDRSMLALYLPLAFSLIWGAEGIIRRVERRGASRWIGRGYLLAQWILTAAVTWRVIEVLKKPVFHTL